MTTGFAAFMARAKAERTLVLQPRMGFGSIEQMREGLLAVSEANGTTVGTITLDSYTRVNDHASAALALRTGATLNGFPLVAHGAKAVRAMLDDIVTEDFPVQVRHGSAQPYDIFATLVEAGIDATEGGPVSYCLPYSRVPLREAVLEWARCCELLAGQADDHGRVAHLESFGGCMLGQMCPPSMLVALSVLEGLFFRQHGLRSISLSYAQQTNFHQDAEAILALRRLAGELLGDVDLHLVLYTFMGVFPHTPMGAMRILQDSARLAVQTGVERLIVKTAAEAYRIPTVAENVEALEFAESIGRLSPGQLLPTLDTGVYQEARQLIEATLEYSSDVGSALIQAFRDGRLDVPYCLHQNNANLARAVVDAEGWLRWADPGRLPVRADGNGFLPGRLKAFGLLEMLGHNERRFDREQLVNVGRRAL
jgi:Glutamate mutase epsilon subunit